MTLDIRGQRALHCKELEAFYYSTRYSPFARHFIADVHDPMAIQFMIMNPWIYGRLIIEIREMGRDGARVNLEFASACLRSVHPSIHPSVRPYVRTSIKSVPFLRWMGATPRLTSAYIRSTNLRLAFAPCKVARIMPMSDNSLEKLSSDITCVMYFIPKNYY